MRRRHNLAHRMNQRQTSSVWEATFQFQKWLSVGAVYLLIHVCSCAIHPKALSWRWSSATENQRHVKKAAWAEDPGLRLTRSLSGQVVANLSSPHSGAYVKYYHITRSNNTLTVTRFLIKSFGNHRRHLFIFFFSQDCFTQWDKECMLVSAPCMAICFQISILIVWAGTQFLKGLNTGGGSGYTCTSLMGMSQGCKK